MIRPYCAKCGVGLAIIDDLPDRMRNGRDPAWFPNGAPQNGRPCACVQCERNDLTIGDETYVALPHYQMAEIVRQNEKAAIEKWRAMK